MFVPNAQPVWMRKLETWTKQKAVQYIVQKHLNDVTSEILKDIVATYNTQEEAWKIIMVDLQYRAPPPSNSVEVEAEEDELPEDP